MKNLFYMHIAKTAGTSINEFICSHYKSSECIVHLESNQDWINADGHDFNVYKYLSGHSSIARIKKIVNIQNFDVMTVFRNPVDHLMSHLSWVKHLHEPGFEKVLKQHSEHMQKLSYKLSRVDFSDVEQLKNYVENLDGFEQRLFDNVQTRYLVGFTELRRVLPEDLEVALQNMDGIKFVGITEDLSTFLRAICLDRKWNMPSAVPRENMAKGYFGFKKDDPEYLKMIEPLIKYDKIVYEKAKEINDAAKNGMGDSVESAARSLSLLSFWRKKFGRKN